MKKYLIILLLFLPLRLFGQPYYIAPTGDDGNAGTTGDPWFNLAYAMNQCSAGDTVYAKSGTYAYDATQTVNVSGTVGNYIVLTSESGDPADVVFDFWTYDMSGEAPQSIYGIYSVGDSYLKFEKFSIRRVWKINTDNGRAHAMFFQNDDYIDINWVVIDSIAGRGIIGYNTGTANITNCDISWCADPQDTDPGNAGTGILWYQTTASATDTVRVTGCRFWQCADQGVGMLTGNVAIVDSCWSWDNDLNAEGYTFGSGIGFKPALGLDTDIDTLHVLIKHSISVFNRSVGLNENTSSGGYKNNFHFYSNTVYGNGQLGIIATEYTYDEDNVNRYHNNLVFNNTGHDMQIQESATHSYNSFDEPYTTPTPSSVYMTSPVTVTTADFIAIPSDAAECTIVLGAVRDANGYLPDIGGYFHLASTSDLIDIGTVLVDDIGEMSYIGDAPDLGAFEWEESDPAVVPTVTTSVTFYSSVSANVVGNVIDDGGGAVSARGICYSTSVNPTTSDFIVPSASGTGIFSSWLYRLIASTTYYIRAYATNETGTSYGADVSFTTPATSPISSGGYIITDGSGNIIIE